MNEGLQNVIFDGGFLMAVAERPTTWSEDIAEAIGKFEPVLLDCVKEELDRLSHGHGRRGRCARVALEMAGRFTVLPCGGAQVDDEIMSKALSDGALAATVDGALLRSLRAAHVRTITLRGGRVSLG